MILGTILLALIWTTLTGSFTLPSFIFGALLGATALFLTREQRGSRSYAIRPMRLCSLTLLFIYELVLSGWRVARLVTSPRMELKPGIFVYPLTVDRDFEITLLANLITLTPGTLSVDVSQDRRLLFVHAIDCSDPEQTRRDIEQGFERKILEAFR